MPKLVCESPIMHDGAIYGVGAELEVDQEQAEVLLSVQAVRLVKAADAALAEPALAEPAKRGRSKKAD